MRHLLAALVLVPSLLSAQSGASVADSSPFRPLALPTPNEVRTGSGRPGKGYWQQRADYRIVASLDTATQIVRGKETIHYVNNSPDALQYLWLQVEQNICAPSSITNILNQPPLAFADVSFDFSCGGFAGEPVMESATVNGANTKRTRYGTMLRIDLPTPLASKSSVDLAFAWHFTVPEQGVGRMGRDGALYEIAQWYPRMCVYDDVRGWNHEPYIGAGEFYLEYGDFDVTLTLPASYIVAATGELQNASQVLTAQQQRLLAVAHHSDTAVAIISRAQVGKPALTRPGNHPYTWHYTAKNVRDFAWAASPDWIWEASALKRGTLIETLYRANADKWTEAHKMARTTIQYFSTQWYPYPWSHATTVEGPVGGMEYPMLTYVPNNGTREAQQWALAHEFGHQWFPMIVGSNERLYPWMDEGFNTFIDLHNTAEYFAGTAYGDTIEVNPLHLAATHTMLSEQPLITNPTEVHDLMWTGYQKPALMMQTLRFEVLGKERFDAAFRDYIRTWAFKHPTPADFFRIMRDNSGMELDWFWRDWVFTTARLDQAIESVSMDTSGHAAIVIANKGTMTLPAELKIIYADGTIETVKLPVEMWNLGRRFVYRVSSRKPVVSVTVDPRNVLPDQDRSNNSWSRRISGS